MNSQELWELKRTAKAAARELTKEERMSETPISEIEQRLRFEALAALIRDMASCDLFDNPSASAFEAFELLRNYVEQAKWLKAEIIEKEDL